MYCPVCKAEVGEGPHCRRCRADLSLLFELEAQRRRMIGMTCQSLSQGQRKRAAALADGIDALRRDEESQRLLAVAHLLRRDFARAWRCYLSRRRERFGAGS